MCSSDLFGASGGTVFSHCAIKSPRVIVSNNKAANPSESATTCVTVDRKSVV